MGAVLGQEFHSFLQSQFEAGARKFIRETQKKWGGSLFLKGLGVTDVASGIKVGEERGDIPSNKQKHEMKNALEATLKEMSATSDFIKLDKETAVSAIMHGLRQGNEVISGMGQRIQALEAQWANPKPEDKKDYKFKGTPQELKAQVDAEFKKFLLEKYDHAEVQAQYEKRTADAGKAVSHKTQQGLTSVQLLPGEAATYIPPGKRPGEAVARQT